MKDVEIIGMLKTYISQTLVGMGALKGANCRIKSIVKSGDLNTVTFIWTDTDGTSKESTMLVLDGTSGIDGVSPTIVVKESTDTKYILTITDATGSFDTPNLKGSGGGGGASALSDLTDVQLTSLAAGNALIYDATAEKWVNMALATVATSGSYNDLSDKPTLGTAAAKASTDTVTEDSTALVESGGVFTAIDNARGDVTETQYSAIASILS